MMTIWHLILRAKIAVGAVFIGVVFGGCGLTTVGETQLVNISTSDGKRVVAIVDGQKVTLPTRLEVKRDGIRVQVLHADNPNYQDSFFDFRPDGKSIGYWLDIVTGTLLSGSSGAVSMFVDVDVGSAYKYSNDSLIVPVYPMHKTDK